MLNAWSKLSTVSPPLVPPEEVLVAVAVPEVVAAPEVVPAPEVVLPALAPVEVVAPPDEVVAPVVVPAFVPPQAARARVATAAIARIGAPRSSGDPRS